MKISGRQVAAARDLLGISQGELALAVGVALTTVARFEVGDTTPHTSTLAKIVNELQRRGIEFTNGDGIGVRLSFAKAEAAARQGAAGR